MVVMLSTSRLTAQKSILSRDPFIERDTCIAMKGAEMNPCLERHRARTGVGLSPQLEREIYCKIKNYSISTRHLSLHFLIDDYQYYTKYDCTVHISNTHYNYECLTTHFKIQTNIHLIKEFVQTPTPIRWKHRAHFRHYLRPSDQRTIMEYHPQM